MPVTTQDIGGPSVRTGLANAAPPSLTDGQPCGASFDLNGNLRTTSSGGSSGASATDEAAFTAGTSTFAPEGGVFNDSLAALTSGQEGTGRQTAYRARHVNLRSNSGTEVGTLANALRTDPVGTTTQPVSIQSGVQSSAPVFGQAKIATTGAAVQLSNSSVPIVSGLLVSAPSNNSQKIVLGNSGVTNTVDGTGNGFILEPGDKVTLPVTNVNVLYINGTSGDKVSYAGC
jgi:hypothetical protein